MSLFSSFQIHAVTAFYLAPATILPNQGWSFLPILHIKYSGRRVKLLPGEVLNFSGPGLWTGSQSTHLLKWQ